MRVIEEEKAQGATEYLLMLAGVLFVVGLTIDYVTALGKKATNAAKQQEDKIFDNLK